MCVSRSRRSLTHIKRARLTLGPADIQEIFGSQFELPELGPLGTHGLANPRDFETPVASFDVDQSSWESTFLPLPPRLRILPSTSTDGFFLLVVQLFTSGGFFLCARL